MFMTILPLPHHVGGNAINLTKDFNNFNLKCKYGNLNNKKDQFANIHTDHYNLD